MTRALIASALAAAVAASPASAQKLQNFEKQFEGSARTPQAPPVNSKDSLSGASADSDDARDNFFAAVLLIPFLPFNYAADEGGESLEAAPYAGEKAGTVQRVDAVFQRVSNDVKGYGLRYAMERASGLGVAGSWTSYRERGAGEDLHHFEASAVADVFRGDAATGRYQLGFGGLSGRRTRAGPRLGLGGDWRPVKPLFLEASAAVTVMEGGALGDLRVAAGVCVWKLQPWIGYRWLVGPLEDLSGPEAGLSVRF